MHLLLGSVVLVQALSKAEPVGQEPDHEVKAVRSDTFISKTDSVAVDKGFVFIVASDNHQMLERCCHGCYNVCQEEMSESDFAERWNDDVPKSLCNLNSASKVEAVYWHQAEGEENDHKCDREVLDMAIVKLWRELYHGNLPREAKEPDEGKNHSYAVKLVMN